MGYYTTYELKWTPRKGENDPVRTHLLFKKETEQENSFINYAIDCDGNSYDSVKWYEHDEDMIALSKIFPDITFILSGEGEESGDIWKKQYINGVMKESRAYITFPDF